METLIKLTVAVTESSSAEFDAEVSGTNGDYTASVKSLGLMEKGKSIREALQELVKTIQKKDPPKLVAGPRAG